MLEVFWRWHGVKICPNRKQRDWDWKPTVIAKTGYSKHNQSTAITVLVAVVQVPLRYAFPPVFLTKLMTEASYSAFGRKGLGRILLQPSLSSPWSWPIIKKYIATFAVSTCLFDDLQIDAPEYAEFLKTKYPLIFEGNNSFDNLKRGTWSRWRV